MKITVEIDGKETVYDEVSAYFLAIQQYVPMQNPKNGDMALLPTMRSFSNGDLREIVKEVAQATVELQELHREQSRKRKRNGTRP